MGDVMIHTQGFCQRGDGWISPPPPSNDSRGDIPQLKFFSGFENFITLSVILRHFEAELKPHCIQSI
jgi:hypothetical protein